MTLVVTRGDLTNQSCEAIVNPANSFGYMGGGVAGKIRRLGGEEIEKEAVKQAPIEIGDAVITSAGALPAKYVIHAPTMRTPGPTSTENVYLATKAACRTAKQLGIRSVAFPGMGTGVGGVSPKEAARTMVKAILEEGVGIDITLVAYDEELFEAFRKSVGK